MADEFSSGNLSEINLRVCDPMEILDVHGACEYLHMSRSTVFRLINDEAIPFCRLNKKLFFVKQDLFNWAKRLSHSVKNLPRDYRDHEHVEE